MVYVDGPHGRLAVDDVPALSYSNKYHSAHDLPLLFVHGNGGNRRQWQAQLDHFRRRRRAVALDLRGMGESDPASGADYTVEGFAGDVAAVAEGLGLSRFILVGHSFGGAVVAAYAGAHPERLAGLVFVDSAGDLSGAPAGQLEEIQRGFRPESYARFTRDWFLNILAAAREETRDAVLGSLESTRPEVFMAATLALYSFRPGESLARYTGPRLSVTSILRHSPLAIHRTEAGIPVHAIEGASHWLMMDRPEEFNRILEEFLEALPTAE